MAQPVQDGNGVWHCNPRRYWGGGPNSGQEVTSTDVAEIWDLCGNDMTTPNPPGNAMPIRAEKQKTGMKKRNVANRSRRQKYSNMNHTTKPVPAPLPPCTICEEETTYCDNNRGDLYQCTGCYFDEFGEVYMAPNPNGITSSLGVRENCPTEGWNSNGIYVTTNAPSSSGGVSSGGVSSGGVSRVTTRPKRPTRPKKKNKR